MNLNSKIGLGTVQFGLDYGISNKSGRTNSEEVSKILQYASENDIDTLDTASAYGEAEKILGENNLDGFRVISKFMPPNEKETIRVQLQQSLEKLKQKNIYGYLAHRPMDVLENPNQWDELLKAKEEKFYRRSFGDSSDEGANTSSIIDRMYTHYKIGGGTGGLNR